MVASVIYLVALFTMGLLKSKAFVSRLVCGGRGDIRGNCFFDKPGPSIKYVGVRSFPHVFAAETC